MHARIDRTLSACGDEDEDTMESGPTLTQEGDRESAPVMEDVPEHNFGSDTQEPPTVESAPAVEKVASVEQVPVAVARKNAISINFRRSAQISWIGAGPPPWRADRARGVQRRPKKSARTSESLRLRCLFFLDPRPSR